MILNKKYICDTNVLLSSLLSKKSPPSEVVKYIIKNGFLAFSDETFSEFEEVFNRPKFDKFISKEKRIRFIEQVRSICWRYGIFQKIDLCRDPKDNKFLDVAIASYADYLITGDDDLLILKGIGNTSIITPRKFIEIHSNKAAQW